MTEMCKATKDEDHVVCLRHIYVTWWPLQTCYPEMYHAVRAERFFSPLCNQFWRNWIIEIVPWYPYRNRGRKELLSSGRSKSHLDLSHGLLVCSLAASHVLTGSITFLMVWSMSDMFFPFCQGGQNDAGYVGACVWPWQHQINWARLLGPPRPLVVLFWLECNAPYSSGPVNCHWKNQMWMTTENHQWVGERVRVICN